MAGSQVIKSIRSHVEKLMADNRRLRDENVKLRSQREKLKSDNREMAGRIAGLEKRITVLELKEGLTGQGDNNKMARARVNRLMREVDKCIALLNR